MKGKKFSLLIDIILVTSLLTIINHFYGWDLGISKMVVNSGLTDLFEK
jgi:hypothetical protein